MSTKRFRMGRALPRLPGLSGVTLAGVALTVLLAAASFAQDALPPAATIVDRHVEAMGGRKVIQAHTSIRMQGTVAVPSSGVTGTLEAFAAAPDKLLVRMNLAGIGESLEGFNGGVAWASSAMTGPMVMQGKELEQRKFDADFHADLRVADRYKSMKTLEKTMWEGRPSYKVSLIRPDGSEDIEYYDVENGLKTGRVITREMMMMGPVQVRHIGSDYRKFGDMLHAASVRQIAMGAEIVMTITSVEYDKVDPSVFELPAAIKALIKPVTEPVKK
jgi:hypothetical protein